MERESGEAKEEVRETEERERTRLVTRNTRHGNSGTIL